MPLPGEINRYRRNQALVRLEHSLLALRKTHNKSCRKNLGAPRPGRPSRDYRLTARRRRPPKYPYWVGFGTTQ
jgi:hypothetical protein